MPDVNEAFAASFRFATTGTQSTPVAQRGLTPPANWGSGLKSTDFKWYTRLPNASPTGPQWATQTSDPLTVGGVTAKSNQYKAAGNPFTINIIGYNTASVISSAQIQVSAFTRDANGNPNYIDAPFKGYVWDLWNSNAALNSIPTRSGNMTVFSPTATYTLS